MNIYKLFSKKIIICAFITLLLVFLQGWMQTAQSQFLPLIVASQQEPDFSSTGRPGRQTSGESRGNCPATKLPLTALMPTSHWGKTAIERPTFWFYVPYSPQEAPIGEFVLQDVERNDIARMPFILPQTPGFASVTLPDERTPLEIEKWYRWYFKVYCDRQRSSSPIFTQGWVQRIALSSELKEQMYKDIIYTADRVWYDAIADLANRRLAQPSNAQIVADWNRLLKAKGVEIELPSSEAIAGNVIFE
ncbi:MAG: DUF928 domain-containing protein [Hydrococcus sp. Prado102]|jgi:hypothetical protein|nr:DUF928 domain-containing protein [Hydrococcus sp. Prado102]